MTQDLKGKVAIVTGASSGIGLEAAKHFLAVGTRVVGAALDMGRFEEIGGADTCAIEVDLTTPEAATQVVRSAISAFGHVDILFNCAGAAPGRESFADVTDKMWQDTFDLNVMGYVRMARAVLPAMLDQGKGAMIHCGSEAGFMPHPLLPDYNVSKAAVHMLSKVLSREFTSRGIRSNVVAPAHVRTELWDVPGGFLESLADQYNVPRGDHDATVAAFLADRKIPAGRLGCPSDVAKAVLFLASDQSEFISGDIVNIDGGVVPTV
ncbi:SDR family NAD(P)-dependent oxidoreductase [Pacificoceanicola onchidii]|uniref:SDR family NAD(P)-dependent oxidoreductase n=1 Tax=Pacificoceanicola onchidii TaxID=2562685 RepID=UPI0010A5C08E|nr:SDR family oxidoreductase [Pacificoceanicola onchidii]